MPDARIAIVGGGLSGLYAALLLEQRGIKDYLLLEARETFGGRIASVSSAGQMARETGLTSDGIDRFDLGPTWFWPVYQPQMDKLVRDLGLAYFEQHETGDMVVELSPQEPPARTRGYLSAPSSMRLVGSMGALIDAIRSGLEPTRLIAARPVKWLHHSGPHIEIGTETAHGQSTTYRAAHVLLALPPRLAAATLRFSPALPDTLMHDWRNTATWMATHAKYVALYDTPFWREQGLSGEARSARGPLGEIHDASMPGGHAALFGFFAIPARVRRSVSDDVMRAHCRTQFARLFGPQAAMPVADVIKDWASDPYTATAADQDGTAQHGAAPAAVAASGVWHGRITGIASEWSPQFPGYVAGAIEAAAIGAQTLSEHIAFRTIS